MHAHRYGEARRNFDTGKMYVPTGVELEGLTLGLIGFGASAQDLARRAKPFGLRILAIDIRPIEEEILAEIQPEFLGGPEDIDRVVAESDYLSLHLALDAGDPAYYRRAAHWPDEGNRVLDQRGARGARR